MTTDTERRFVAPLPGKPNLDNQRKRAKALMRAYCAGDDDAAARVAALHPTPPQPDAFKLSDAQLVVARGYGFASWPKLKQKIDALTKTPTGLFVDAVKAGDVAEVSRLLAAYREVAQQINAPLFEFGRMAVHAARDNLPLLDVLLAHGADINRKSDWEHGGFGVLEDVNAEKAEPLVARGAVVDVWAAAHLGLGGKLRALLDADASLVNAKGGDGKRPLHYAHTVEVAALLLERGAEIDALDDDHDSTPAQYMVGDRPDVCRFLIERGARTDLMLAVALGDVDLVRRHLNEDPGSIRMRISQEWFPMIDTAKNGGHIYQWSIGFYLSVFQVARKFGHDDVLALLNKRARPVDWLLEALWTGDLATADDMLATRPYLISGADPGVWRQVVDAARYNNTAIVAAMLSRGFPVTATGQHDAMPLHFAAFHGNDEMVREVLRYDPPLEARDRDFEGTPTGWAIHGAMNGWPGISSDSHDACVRLLLDAGANFRDEAFPVGHDAIDAVLRAHLFGR